MGRIKKPGSVKIRNLTNEVRLGDLYHPFHLNKSD